MSSQAIALIDMDGTIADYAGAMKRGLRAIASPDDKIPEDLEDVPEHIARRQHLIKSVPGWWENLSPLHIGVEIVDIIRSLKFDLHILTKRPYSEHALGEKVIWCKKHIPDAKITITDDKGLVYGRVLMDDYPPYIEQWLEWRPRGLVIMPDQSYNKDFEHPNVVRLTQLIDPSLIEKLKEAKDRESDEWPSWNK